MSSVNKSELGFIRLSSVNKSELGFIRLSSVNKSELGFRRMSSVNKSNLGFSRMSSVNKSELEFRYFSEELRQRETTANSDRLVSLDKRMFENSGTWTNPSFIHGDTKQPNCR
ncbi:lactosylceramide 1 3-N-acetyl-beta-D-glucosaminyltransferase-like X3 [Biomphalaria glabrata]